MSEKKSEIIKRMLEMQKKFIDLEHKSGVDMQDYYTPSAGHPLDGYRKEYETLSRQLIDLAHEEAGSHR